MILRTRQRPFSFPRPTILMGVVNATPDSFSDGGQFLDPQAAVDHALNLEAEGAEILDIGGESTRPNAEPVSAVEELRRVMPILEKLHGKTQALISIDTYKPEVAREAVAAGASLINDIGAHRPDAAMWQVAAESQAGYVLMHIQGTPQTMQRNPLYENVARDVEGFFGERLRQLAEAGVDPERVIIDVGIGFGKRREHNLQLLAGLKRFGRFQRPLLIGVSRKSFLGARTGAGPQDRLPAALAIACWAVEAGAQLIRTHDVKATLQAVRMTEELLENQRLADLSL